MIKATIYKDDDNNIKRYMVKGHANYDEYGKDIVCAAASVLTQNTLISLVELLDLESSVKYEIDNETGFIDVKLLDISREKELEVNILLDSLELGLKGIAENYPDYMTLETRGCS